MSELPKGWAETTLDDLGQWRGGGTPSKQNPSFWTDGDIPWVSPKDMKRYLIDGSEDRITAAAVENSATQLIPSQSVLVVTRSGILRHSLPIAVNTCDVTINQDLKALLPGIGIEASFVAAELRAEGQAILAACAKSGTTVDSVDFERLKEFRFKLAPLAEQRRIVAKLDLLTGATARARAELDRIPTLITRYRRAILSAAFDGELTREWREANGLSAPEAVELGTLVTELRYGTAQKCYPESPGIAVLRIPNISSGRIDLSDLKYAELDDASLSILVIRSNGSAELVGLPAIVTSSEVGLAYAGYLIRLRPNRERIVPRFLALMLEAPEVRRVIETGARSTSGVHNINSTELAALRVPRFELAEQAEIVRRIDTAFAWLDRVAVEHANATRLLPRLDQAILAKAFRGELVPQDPNDESASILLERVRAAGDDTPRRSRQARLRGVGNIHIAGTGALTVAQKEQDVNKTRKDVPPSHLCDIVKKSGGEIKSAALWRASQMQIDEFYKLLRDDVSAKRLKESKDKASITDAR
jgi:type I restriction enzyme S subunit